MADYVRPKDLEIYDPEAAGAPPASELVTVVDHADFAFPQQAPYLQPEIAMDFTDASKADVLALLEVSDVVQSSDLENYVEKSGAKVLSDVNFTTELSDKLNDLDTVVYTLLFPSGATVSDRCASATVPSGFTVAAHSTPTDLLITHNLGRKIANVTVFATDGSGDRLLYGNAAFSGVLAPTNNTLIVESLATINKAIVVQLIFA